MEKPLISSPSFNELFENGKAADCDHDQDSRGNNDGNEEESLLPQNTNVDLEQHVTLTGLVSGELTNEAARCAPQSLCCGEPIPKRPSSSYSKTRSGYDADSTTPQLNLTPGADIQTDLESLDYNEPFPVGFDSRSTDIMSTNDGSAAKSTRTTKPTQTSSLRTPLEATENLSPAVDHSSFFLPETPPAPQARHDVLEDKGHISQLSLQPHIEDSGSPITPPLSFMPTLRSPTLTSKRKSPLLFSSVPLDALHSIAGYLTVAEWRNLSLVSREAHLVCREIFKKMKMHGFKCAVEVISAWEMGEHGDAKELAALYLKSGVPIYPAPFGHEYHTVNWRMKMEVTRISQSSENESSESSDTEVTINENQPSSSQNANGRLIDRFYTERTDARTTEYNNRLTYLEEKGIFWRNVHYTANGIIPETTRNTQNRPQRVNIRPIPPPLPPGFGFFALFDEDDEDANFNHIMEQGRIVGIGENIVVEPGNEHLPHIEFGRVPQRNNETNQTVGQTSSQRRSFENQSRASLKIKGLHIPVKCHKHLVDQHMQRHAAVNDERGTMVGSNLSLSADFFHSVGQRDLKQDFSEHNVISLLDLKVYGYESEYLHGHYSNPCFSKLKGSYKRTDSCKPDSSLRETVHRYEKRLLALLERTDYENFDECLLDFWDEFFKVSATVHFYDKFSPVPRMSYKRQFLSQPCPKAFGTVQCEIERIKVYHKHRGVGVTGRLFPTYEYRLIVRDRRRIAQFDVPVRGEDVHPRLDTLLMTAKHRGRHHTSSSCSNQTSSRRGVNNYHFYMPQQEDIDDHLESVNEAINVKDVLKGYRQREVPGSQIELGRLQSNFIGTEFQIFSPNNISNSSPLDDMDNQTPETNQLPFDTNINSPQVRNLWKKKSKKLLRVAKSLRCQSDENDVNGEHRSRKGRITPWSSFSKKKVVADTEKLVTTDKEIGAITYTANLLGNRPRVMDVCIPKIDNETGLFIPFEPNVENSEESTILSNLKTLANQQQQNANEDEEEGDDAIITNLDNVGLLALQNRPPWWNVELGAFVLNFGGRVSVASVKNFQLCDRHDHENIMLQFGRIEGRHYFTMDFSYPLSPLQAFAIAVSSLQSKISFA